MTKISIIVPIYNVEDYLSECIESMCKQTYENIEIILVDDGSTDNSLEIAKTYAAKDSRIKLISQKNQGANVARNAGLNAATGEWVCFADGDDWVDSNMCKELLEYASSDIDIIFYSYRSICGSTIKEAARTDKEFKISKNEFVELQHATLNRLGPYRFGVQTMDTVSVWDKMYRLDFLRKNNLRFIDELPKLQDLLFNLDVYDCAESGYVINKSYYNYRINEGSVSKRYQENIVNKFDVIHKYLAIFMEKHADDEIMKQAYYERIATHARTCMVLNFCNHNNPKSYMVRRKEFLEMCNREVMSQAIDKVNLKHYTLKETILSICIKYRWFFGCNVLYKLNQMRERLQ